MRKQVEAWQKSELTDVTAKVVIYEAFAEGKLAAAPFAGILNRVLNDADAVLPSLGARGTRV